MTLETLNKRKHETLSPRGKIKFIGETEKNHHHMADEDQGGPNEDPPGFQLDLPGLPLMQIASYLSGTDLLNFTHVSKDIFEICNTVKNVWIKRLADDKIPLCPEIAAVAKTMVENNLSKTDNVDKLTYFMHRRTIYNWKKGYFRRVAKIPSGRSAKQADDQTSSLVVKLQPGPDGMNTTLSVWDIVQEKLTQNNATLVIEPATFCHRIYWTGSFIITVFINFPTTAINIFANDIGQRDETQLKEKWKFSRTNDIECFQTVLGSQFLGLVYYQREFLLDLPFTVEGLRLCDGSTLFSFTIARNYLAYPSPLNQGQWFVICSIPHGSNENRYVPQLQVINSEENSVKDLAQPEVMKYLTQTFIRDDHLIGCYIEGAIGIWDLKTGQVIKEIYPLNRFYMTNPILVSYCPAKFELVMLDKFYGLRRPLKLIKYEGEEKVTIEFPNFPDFPNLPDILNLQEILQMPREMSSAYFAGQYVQVIKESKRIKRHYWHKYFVRVYDLNSPDEMNIYVLFESKVRYYVAFLTPTLLGLSDYHNTLVFDYLNTKLYDKF